MDLPPDKMKMLRDFPAEKKWDIIRDRVSEIERFHRIFESSLQDQVIAKHPPEYYINGLQTYIRGANLVEKAATLVRMRIS